MNTQHYETALIASCLFHEDAIAEVVAKVLPKDFSPEYRFIYQIIVDLFNAGVAPDAISVAQRMEDSGVEDSLGWIQELPVTSWSQKSIDSHCRELKRLSLSWKLKNIAIQAARWADEEDPDTAYQMATSALMDLEEQEDEILIGMNDMLTSYVTDLERRFDADQEMDGLSTGFVDLDARIMGMKPQNLIVIAGRPSMGKTTLAMNMVEHNVREGNPCLVFTMEMSADELIGKTISSAGRLSFTRLSTANLREDDWPRLSTSVMQLRDKPLVVDERGGLSIAQIRARCYQVKRKMGLKLVVIDYLQLMRGEGQNRENEIGSLSRGLKGLAKELDCPVIVISQLNRKCEDRPNKRPVNSDLRDSGAIEQDANIILFVYRDEIYNEDTQLKGVAEIICRKYRGGKIGTDCLAWQGDFQRFDNLEHRPDVEALAEEQEQGSKKRNSRAF